MLDEMEYTDQTDFEERNLKNAELLLDENRGIYIPQVFAKECHFWECFDDEQKDILLSGPENELYWDVWTEVLDNAFLIHNGKKWTLYQDGDLWAIPEEITAE